MFLQKLENMLGMEIHFFISKWFSQDVRKVSAFGIFHKIFITIIIHNYGVRKFFPMCSSYIIHVYNQHGLLTIHRSFPPHFEIGKITDLEQKYCCYCNFAKNSRKKYAESP